MAAGEQINAEKPIYEQVSDTSSGFTGTDIFPFFLKSFRQYLLLSAFLFGLLSYLLKVIF